MEEHYTNIPFDRYVLVDVWLVLSVEPFSHLAEHKPHHYWGHNVFNNYKCQLLCSIKYVFSVYFLFTQFLAGFIGRFGLTRKV